MARVPKPQPQQMVRFIKRRLAKLAASSERPFAQRCVLSRRSGAATELGVQEYAQVEHRRQILEQLARSEREIATGSGHDLDSVLEEADELLAANDP